MRNRLHPPARRRLRGAAATLALAGALAVVLGVTLSEAAPTRPTTLGIAKGVTVGGHASNIVTNSRGVTVYTLSGDTAHHIKCTKANGCLTFWPPVTVHSKSTKLTAAPGIHGRLALLHRDGFFQVTLGGHPLYTFLEDHGKRRSATGQGIVSFGGTWKVIAITSQTQHTTSTTTTSTSASSPAYGY
jgi:predicted lipoprotein with Yx(FWY)xxD motif